MNLTPSELNQLSNRTRVLILGCNGYLGESLTSKIKSYGIDVLGLTRKDVHFTFRMNMDKFHRILNDYNPTLILNAVGAIDNEELFHIEEIFESQIMPII